MYTTITTTTTTTNNNNKVISQSIHYRPLFIRCSLRKMAKFKTLSFGQTTFFQHHTSSCTASIGL